MKSNAALNQLIELLTQEIGLYRALQKIIDREKDAAIQSDLSALGESQLKKEKLLFELRCQDAKRRQSIVALAVVLNRSVDDLTVTEIAHLVDDPQAGRLRNLGREFNSVLTRLQASNQRNKQLFEHSLELVRGSFNMLSDLLSPATVYYRTGDIQNKKSTGKCVCSEI